MKNHRSMVAPALLASLASFADDGSQALMSEMGRAAGTESQVEPTTGTIPSARSVPSVHPFRPAHGGFILSGSPSSSAPAFARVLEVPYQPREFVILGIEVGHR